MRDTIACLGHIIGGNKRQGRPDDRTQALGPDVKKAGEPLHFAGHDKGQGDGGVKMTELVRLQVSIIILKLTLQKYGQWYGQEQQLSSRHSGQYL